MAEGKSDPQPGDLIEIFRPFYQHWALYVGDGYVIHVTAEGASFRLFSGSSSGGTRAKVKKELLKVVVENHKWRVNNKYDCYCTPFPVEMIIQRAELCIDKELRYDVLSLNCEHFVTILRYGKGVSRQLVVLQSLVFLLLFGWRFPGQIQAVIPLMG
ncbi:phospholipase A and acyltransferase 1-like isoform 2-T2 [Passerculus sandwichensis]